MDKGIRLGVNAKFAEMLPQLPTLGGKAFRRAILDWAVEEFNTTMPSASTHYNFSFHAVRKATPELVVGLGRAEGKNNGGRKKKSAVTPNALLANMLAATGRTGAEAVAVAVVVEAAAETTPVQTFNVCKKSDSSVVAAGVSFEAAQELINKAAAQKKAKLYFI